MALSLYNHALSLMYVATFIVLSSATVSAETSPGSSTPSTGLQAATSQNISIESTTDQLSKALGLTGNDQRVFSQLYRSYRNDMDAVQQKRVALVEEASAIGSKLTDEQAAGLIRRALELDDRRVGTKRRHVGLFLEKLSPRIVARFFQLEHRAQLQADARLVGEMALVGDDPEPQGE